MKIEWDNDKNQANKKKHGVSFEEAGEIFLDPLHLSILDERFDYGEERWITIGKTKKRLLVVAAHTWIDINGYETVRIISARKVTKREKKDYESYTI